MADGELDSIRRYYVASEGKGWEVIANRQHLGWFSSQSHALQQAVSWAQEDTKNGGASQVFLKTGLDEFKIDAPTVHSPGHCQADRGPNARHPRWRSSARGNKGTLSATICSQGTSSPS
jgi:hypothetical protein